MTPEPQPPSSAPEPRPPETGSDQVTTDAPTPTPTPPAPPATPERIIIVPTRWYWFGILGSILIYFLAAAFYLDELGIVPQILYWSTVLLCALVILWGVVGLMKRGRVIARATQGTRRAAGGLVEGLRSSSERHEGATGRFARRWGRRLAGIIRLIRWVVLLPIRILIWAYYTVEVLFWRIVLLFYDVVYYLAYAAWQTLHWAWRTANRIVWLALKIAWFFLKIPTRLPFIRTWWRTKQRPAILAAWNASQERRRHRRQVHIENGRRLAATRGENPARWEADYRRRRGFPLPRPEKARLNIRKRIAKIREHQRLRREGKHIPRRRRQRPSDVQVEPAPEASATAAGETSSDAGSASTV